MKLLKNILSFFLLLILQLGYTNSFASFSTNEELCVSEIELSEKPNSDFLELLFKENYIFEHSFLDIVSFRSVSFCDGYAELVESWKTIKYCGDDELAKLATNLDELGDVAKNADEITKAGGYKVWKASRPTRLVEGKNIFRASSQEYSLAKKSFKEYREGVIYEQSKILSGDDLTSFKNEFNGKNLAKVEGQLDGVPLNNDIRISGERFKGEPIFDSYKVDKTGGIGTEGAWSREWDTEYVMLSEIAQSKGAVKGGIYTDVTGEIKIISELPYCVSCQGVIQDFSNMFPNVDIILIDALK